MILVADSGSTKAHWRLVDDEEAIHQYETIGFNPLFIDTPSIYTELQNTLLPNLPQGTVGQVFFYGASCSSPQRNKVVADALQMAFTQATIYVDHDMLAAARALCQNQPGFAAILGTGSNTCYYNGIDIESSVPSLGYVLGDEGSGAYIGRMLVRGFLYGDMPTDLATKFADTYKQTKDDIITAVYTQPLPNKYLAQFTRFAGRNVQHPYIAELVTKAFDDFFENHICRYPNYTNYSVGFVGSVAFYFNSLLRHSAAKHNVTVGTIVEAPIAALTLYHLEVDV